VGEATKEILPCFSGASPGCIFPAQDAPLNCQSKIANRPFKSIVGYLHLLVSESSEEDPTTEKKKSLI